MISIIIPARNESDLGHRLSRLVRQFEGVEIVVVDTSLSVSSAYELGPSCKYLHAPSLKTRAEAMNFGARQAKHEILWFLHVDMIPPVDGANQILKATQNGVVAGAFIKTYQPSSPLLRLQSQVTNRLALSRHWFLVGTNGFFIRRELFFECGGFPLVPLLEDALMFDEWRHNQHFKMIDSPIEVSSRKYARLGGLPRTLRNTLIYSAFRIGISPKKLAKWYT